MRNEAELLERVGDSLLLMNDLAIEIVDRVDVARGDDLFDIRVDAGSGREQGCQLGRMGRRPARRTIELFNESGNGVRVLLRVVGTGEEEPVARRLLRVGERARVREALAERKERIPDRPCVDSAVAKGGSCVGGLYLSYYAGAASGATIVLVATAAFFILLAVGRQRRRVGRSPARR